MNAFTDGLKLTTDSIGGVAAGIGKGLQSIEHGLNLDSKEGSKEEQASDTKKDTRDTQSEHTSTLEHDLQSDIKEDTKLEPTQPPSAPAGPANLFTTLTSGATTLLAPTTYVAKSGASLARDATSAGLSIGSKVAHSGLDISVNVATGTASLAGTALGGVVAAAAETSGVVFQPVGSGLKALEGLDRLGEQGVQAINGLSLGAVRKVSEMTTKALNMSGKVPRHIYSILWLMIFRRPPFSTLTQMASFAFRILSAASSYWAWTRRTQPMPHTCCTLSFHTPPRTAGFPP